MAGSGRPRQVREYREEDSLTEGTWRARLLTDALDEVGAWSTDGLSGRSVLEIGCGYGGLSMFLAEQGVGRVIAVDVELDQVRVVHDRRGRAAAGDRVVTFVSDATRLPLPSGTIDLVLMVGVAEWIPFGRPDLDARSAQVRAFEEIRRVLKPSGRVIVGTKNRLYPRYTVSDAQLGIPLVNALPRRLADLVTRRLRGIAYRSRIYSVWGWRRLFRSAGLEVRSTWVALYNYQYPLALLPPWTRARIGALVEGRLGSLPPDVVREVRHRRFASRDRFYAAIFRTGMAGLLAGCLVFELRRRA